MRFEWDEARRQANLAKHGLDFADAEAVFAGPMVTSLDVREDYDEERWVGLGILNARVVFVVYTEPEEETIRLISLRKAVPHEQKRYEREVILG